MLRQSFMAYSRRVVSLALPMAWSRFIQVAGWVMGMMIVAHLGQSVLAASALISAIQTTIILFFMSILFAVGVIAGRLHGEEKNSEIGLLLQQGLLLGIGLSVVMMVVFYFIDDLLMLMGQPPELVSIAGEYFRAFVWACVPMMFLVALQQLCYGILKQRLVIYNNLISLAVFVPLTYGLVHGKWGLPACGVRGLAYAILVQCLVNVATLSVCLFSIKHFSRYCLFKRHNHHGFPYFKQLFQVGWPMSVQFGGELLAFSVLTLFTGWISVAALSAMQVSQQIVFLLLVPLFAVAEAAGILVSQSIGAKKFDEVRDIGNVCVLLGSLLIFMLALVLVFFPDQLTALYIDINNPANAQVVELARWLFYLSAPMLFLETLRNLYSGALRGFYDTFVPMWIGLFSICMIAIPFAYGFAFWLDWGVVGIRAATILGFFFGAIVLWQRWRRKTKTQ